MPTNTAQTIPQDAAIRRTLHDEVHARPVARIRVPALVTNVTVLHDGSAAETERNHLRTLVRDLDIDPDFSDSTFVQIPLSGYTVKWERHGEFSVYTIIQSVDLDGWAYDEAPDLLGMLPVPPGWLEAIPGHTISATHVLLLPTPADKDDVSMGRLAQRLLGPGRLYGSSVKEDSARLYTTYRMGRDRTTRFLLLCRDLTDGRAGRIIASLIDMEIYRVLALQAFLPAKAVAATLPKVENRLAELTSALENGSDEDEVLLHDLIQLAAEVETNLAEHTTRFAATRAYFSIVQQRIDDLRGTSLPGLMGVFTFLRRRLLPAMATVESTEKRLSDLSERVDRAGDLLRTRVDISTETQNQELLKSLHRGQRVQLRLQETVEGLSIAAITYYVVGLLGYGSKAVKAAGVHVNSDLMTGLSVPLAALFVWWVLRRVKARIHD
jgi:uncharacterized membrane-anchored protein